MVEAVGVDPFHENGIRLVSLCFPLTGGWSADIFNNLAAIFCSAAAFRIRQDSKVTYITYCNVNHHNKNQIVLLNT